MELPYPENTVWYIEARSKRASIADDEPASHGSGVVIRLKKRGESGTGRRYLLTCAHVVRGQSTDGVDGHGPLFEDLRVWAPGNGFVKEAFLHASVANDVKSLEACDVPMKGRIAVNDWAILDVKDEVFRQSAVAVHDCAKARDGEHSIVGYPGGSNKFLDHLVKPSRTLGLRFRDFHSRVVRLHGDESRRGMSGGGLFDQAGRLVGIHRSRLESILECHSLSASYIREMLFEEGYEVCAGDTRSQLPDDKPIGAVDPKDQQQGCNPSRRTVLVGALGLAGLAGLVWWRWPTRIRIGIKQWVGYAPLVVMAKLDLRKDIQIVFEPVKAIDDSSDMIKKREIDVGMWIAASHVVNRSERTNARVVLKLDDSYGEDGIVVKDSVRTIQDLNKGKVLYQRHDAGHCMLLELCRRANDMDIDDIDLEHVAVEAVKQNFPREEVVAATVYGDFLSNSKPNSDEMKRRVFRLARDIFGQNKDDDSQQDEKYGIVDVLAVHDEFLQKNRDAIGSLIEGWFEAVKLLKESNKSAVDIACAFMGEGVRDPSDPVVYGAPQKPAWLERTIRGDNVKLADRNGNVDYFQRDVNGNSNFRRDYEYYRTVWKSDLGTESHEFVDADGSQDFHGL